MQLLHLFHVIDLWPSKRYRTPCFIGCYSVFRLVFWLAIQNSQQSRLDSEQHPLSLLVSRSGDAASRTKECIIHALVMRKLPVINLGYKHHRLRTVGTFWKSRVLNP